MQTSTQTSHTVLEVAGTTRLYTPRSAKTRQRERESAARRLPLPLLPQLLPSPVLSHDNFLNATDERSCSALLHACKSGNVDAALALVETSGVDLELRDDQGMTAVMWSAMLGFRVIVVALLQVKSLEVNALTPDGLSALGLACEAGQVDVVQQLATHPAVDVNATNSGRTPLVAALERAQHECVRVLLQHPAHSLSRAGVRPPYLPPNLKAMVNLYRNNSQVRHALVLCAPPPSLVLDGVGRAGEGCVAGGGEVASVLLSLPRPFQVIQHVLRRATPQSLSTQVQDFASKIDASAQGAAVLYVSGEIFVTPAGPALSLPAPSAHATPTNVLLSSLLHALAPAPTLVFLLDAVGVTFAEDLPSEGRAAGAGHALALPPLAHPKMAALVGVSAGKKQVVGSRCTPFSAACAREIIHGVTLPQLHERVNLSLRQERREENSSSSSSRSKAVFVSNMSYEWLF